MFPLHTDAFSVFPGEKFFSRASADPKPITHFYRLGYQAAVSFLRAVGHASGACKSAGVLFPDRLGEQRFVRYCRQAIDDPFFIHVNGLGAYAPHVAGEGALLLSSDCVLFRL